MGEKTEAVKACQNLGKDCSISKVPGREHDTLLWESSMKRQFTNVWTELGKPTMGVKRLEAKVNPRLKKQEELIIRFQREL